MGRATQTYLDTPPSSQTLTSYDREHMKLYMRLLDAERDGEQLQDLRRVVDRQQASSFVIEIQVLQRHAALVEMN